MSTQRELVCKNSYRVLSRRKIGANRERVEIEVTEPKAHWFSRQKKEIINIMKPIKGGPSWKEDVWTTYGIMDDLFLWTVVYYPMISEAFDYNIDTPIVEAAEIIDSSPQEHEVAPINTRESEIIEVEPTHHGVYHEPVQHESHYESHDYSSHNSYDSGSSDGCDSGGGGGGGSD